MNKEKTYSNPLRCQPNRNGSWYVADQEIQIYEDIGFFDSEEDWLSFYRERKARSLDYARPMNLNLMVAGPASSNGINAVIYLIQQQTGRNQYQPSRLQLNCLLANLLFQYGQSPSLWTVVSRAHERTIIKKYNLMGVNYQTLANICDALYALNVIDLEIGHTETGKGKKDGHLTRIRATDECITLLSQCGWQQSLLHFHPSTEPVVMKAKPAGKRTSKVIDYEDTPKAKTTRELLWEYHHFLRRNEILLPTGYGDFVPDLIFMRQIFSNGSWEEGGRLFGGGYQQLSGADRAKIKIDGKPIVEIDIASCHATMAFAEAGISWFSKSNQDLYQRDQLSQWPRDIIKRAFNIAINAENEKKAAAALINANNKEGWFHEHPELKKPGWQSILLSEIKAAYPELSHLLFQGRGMHYMKQEGEIALIIIEDCMSLGIPVLTLHDSFIAPAQDEQKLRSIIATAFKKVVGVSCQLK